MGIPAEKLHIVALSAKVYSQTHSKIHPVHAITTEPGITLYADPKAVCMYVDIKHMV